MTPPALQLLEVSYRSGRETWLHPLDLTLTAGQVNVLLGATRAGKTTLLRIMAGLDRPASGQLLRGGQDITGLDVRRRNVAMVYQQFINYPSMTVYDNIASPLRLAGRSATDIRAEVTSLAEALQLSALLHRYPAELSGGQQQRTALARALAKRAELLLLDEPLVNLDYKLREELRMELRRLFEERSVTVVYATTDPLEALQLGGQVAILGQGRLLQTGPTLEVFRRPATLAVAQAFSDPPFNSFTARIGSGGRSATLADGTELPLPEYSLGRLLPEHSEIVLGIRPHALTPSASPVSGALNGRVDLAEISGSDTYLHFSSPDGVFVAQLRGIHDYSLGERCTLHVAASALYGFDRNGSLLFSPAS